MSQMPKMAQHPNRSHSQMSQKITRSNHLVQTIGVKLYYYLMTYFILDQSEGAKQAAHQTFDPHYWALLLKLCRLL